MPKKYSIKLRRDFERLFKFGVRKASQNFSIIFVDAEDLKFAFIVDRKIAPKAVDRIYAKRIMREIVRKFFLKTCLKPLHIGIRPLSNLKVLKEKTGFENVKNELVQLLNQIDFSRPAFKKIKK